MSPGNSAEGKDASLCRFVLERFREAYVNDALAREQNVTAEECLAFHQTHSGPAVEQLKIWLHAQFEEKKVEPNSGRGWQ